MFCVFYWIVNRFALTRWKRKEGRTLVTSGGWMDRRWMDISGDSIK